MDLSNIKENIVVRNIAEYAEFAYLEYAMSVVKGRAIPSVEDGLKPVHRRILYAMHKEGMVHSSVHKKSARVVGNVLGFYHPHGDQSVYDALVRQAQDFSIRYPLVDGQGNFGSRDGDSAASMRYTEAKLSPITQLYLEEIRDNCVDFMPNYDGTEQEPKFLPARVPFILLNGNPGIGVGMASDIPCHNITEVIKGAIAYLEDEDISLDTLMTYIKGPDLPTGAQIISSTEELKKIYSEGRGSFRVRAKYKIEDEGGKNWKLIFYEIPSDVSVKNLMEQIDAIFNPEDRSKDSKGGNKKISQEQMRLKNIFSSMISNYVDASDKEHPVRLVIEPKSYRQNPQELVKLLLGYTDLEKNIASNFVMVGRDGRPVQKNLLEIMGEWTSFRKETVTRRVEYHLYKIAERLHILEGRKIILSNIDEVIRILKNSEKAKEDLINRFGLSEIQAQDVLELKLRQIGKLELFSVEKEITELNKKQEDLKKIIANEKNLKKQIIKELSSDLQKFQDDRKSEILYSMKTDVSDIEEKTTMITQEDVTLALSKKGWIKSFKGIKNAEELTFKEGDKVDYFFHCKNTDTVCVFDVQGFVYNITITELNKEGAPINTLIQLNAKFSHIYPINKDKKYVLTQSSGFGFIVAAENLMTRLKAGKKMIEVTENSQIFNPVEIPLTANLNDYNFAVITSENKLLTYKLDLISETKGKAKGVVLCGLPDGIIIKSVKVFNTKEKPFIEVKNISKSGKENIIKIEKDLKTYEKGRSTKGSFVQIKDKTVEIDF